MNNVDQKINELKKLWQDQEFNDNKKNENRGSGTLIIKRLKTYEKLQFRINLFKTIMIIITMGLFTWYLFKFRSPSATLLIGLFWILVCLLVFIIYYWKKQFQVNQLNYSLQTNAFIDLSVKKLKEQIKIFKSFFPFLVTGLIIGLNLIYFSILNEIDLTVRIFYHIAGSLFLAALIPLGLKIREWKFKKEQQPVIDDLISIKEEIKE